MFLNYHWVSVSYRFIVVDALKCSMELEEVNVLSKTPVHFNNEHYIVIVKYNKQNRFNWFHDIVIEINLQLNAFLKPIREKCHSPLNQDGMFDYIKCDHNNAPVFSLIHCRLTKLGQSHLNNHFFPNVMGYSCF